MSDGFSVKIEGGKQLIDALSAYPKILRKYAHKLVTDEAVLYKQLGPGVIDEHEIIRSPGFVQSAFVFNRSQGTSIDNIHASAGTAAPGRLNEGNRKEGAAA
ncbi:hypothetical protein AGMMS49991_11220 [Spirochaetia bacterium]|nr:hypothetical protein AGMMS49991_11220 [Spirochaetia bacterium]